jgi:hypothetical protein
VKIRFAGQVRAGEGNFLEIVQAQFDQNDFQLRENCKMFYRGTPGPKPLKLRGGGGP